MCALKQNNLWRPSLIIFFSLQGGKEHGVPILISEIHPNLPADRCQELYVGDAILSVNGINLLDMKHADAVEILSQQVGFRTGFPSEPISLKWINHQNMFWSLKASFNNVISEMHGPTCYQCLWYGVILMPPKIAI